MTTLQIIFYLFAACAVTSSIMVVSARNSVHSVLFLVFAFFAMAGIWVLLSAEFLALILVLVYVGAVMTLFLFVVMMLNLDLEKKRESFVRYLPFAILIVFLMLALTIYAVGPAHFGLMHVPAPHALPADYSNTAQLGAVLYTEYAYPFEISAVLLLTSIIAAICLTHRHPKKRKVQNIADQINIQRDQRIKLVSMPAEKKNNSSKPESPL